MFMPKLFGLAAFLAILIAVSTAVAQMPDQEPSTNASSSDAQNASEQKKEKRGEYLLAPIPVANPAIGSGLEWAVAYVFAFNKQDKISPSSVAGIGGLLTDNGSRALAVGGKLYLKQDRYRFTGAFGGAKINADVYGVGKLAGDRALYVPLTVTGTAFIAESLFRVRKNIYLGPRFQYRDVTLSLNRENLNLPDGVNPPPPIQDVINELAQDLFQQRTVAIAPRFQWDTRDQTYYPHHGILLESGVDLFAKGLGSKFTYQYYKTAFNLYTSIGSRQVVAFRGMGCAAAGDHVPIYDLCLFGSSNDLRGYSAGRYQDRRMFATQAEYRLVMPPKKFLGRVGVVAFGGFGGVGRTFSDIGWGELLPSGGAGLRFRMTKKDHINFRVDYGVGRVGHTLNIGIGEAF